MALSRPTIAVYREDVARLGEAAMLAARLCLPLVESADDHFDFLLTYTARRLELRKTGHAAPGPVYVDFLHGSFGYRRAHGEGHRQPLLRAVGLRGSTKPSIIDVTAGLGRDAFVLAMLGCRVAMLERSPVVHALLIDGLERASSDPSLQSVCERLSLYHEDAVCYLAPSAQDKPDVVYLDPMYSQTRQSALNKKEMRVLRAVVGDDEDAPRALSLALGRATRRVVVKRPRLAPPLEGPLPHAQIKGTSTRYDVYSVSGV